MQSKFKGIQDNVKPALRDYPVKWEDSDKFHLTLRFLGEIANDKISELIFVLDRRKFEFDTIKFTAKGIGFFPNQNYPNVVFVDLEEHGNNSQKLVKFIDRIILNFGVKPDKRFVPHVTLGRFKRDKRVKIDKQIIVKVEQIGIEMDSFYLMKSILTPKGSVYETINQFKFNPNLN
ncbi:MAG: RNA 2',3'-cyclic phosphodiesterase [Chlorobi bacterium]|nr:RNA 2',3'-cyclic phosphodiesterase [Chlorobiota bacterium]